MRYWIIPFVLVLSTPLSAQINTVEPPIQIDLKKEKSYPGIAVFGELLGKGYFSANVDVPVVERFHASVGITSIDFVVYDRSQGNDNEGHNYLCPGLMVYKLFFEGPSFLEVGGGVSAPLAREYEYVKDPYVLHGVIGYRWQRSNASMFRIGFTPFLQPPDEFWPFFGLSYGYSF